MSQLEAFTRTPWRAERDSLLKELETLLALTQTPATTKKLRSHRKQIELYNELCKANGAKPI